MDTKLLLVKAITLLYRESQLTQKTSPSNDTVISILTLIKAPESYAAGDFGKDPLTALRETARWMAANPSDYTYDKSEILQRLRCDSGHDESLFNALFEGINPDLDDDAIKGKVLSYRMALLGQEKQGKVKDLIKKAYSNLWYQSQNVDWRHFVKDHIEEMTPFANMDMDQDAPHPSLVTDIDFSKPESIRAAFTRGVEQLDTRGILRTGLQGLNRMMGAANGFRRGEFWVTSALQFNYKSGLALDIFRHTALYNKPYMLDPERKPMIIRITLENSAENDIMSLYKSLVEIKTGVPVDPAHVDPIEATRHVIEEMERNGYHIRLLRLDPSDFTFHDLFDMIIKYERDGYEVHMLNIDYLNMMSKRGCNQGPAGSDVRDLFRRVRNFTSKRGITTITPHQLSTEAKVLTRAGVENFVQEIANKGYYDSCRTLDQEVDGEIYQHIVIVNGVSYLTLQRGKHRKVGVTPQKDLYTVYQFNPVGGIIDDIYGPDMSRRTVGGDANSNGGAGAWWDT